MGKPIVFYIEPENYPQYLTDWIKPRLGVDETIMLCLQFRNQNKDIENSRFVVLTTQKFIFIDHFLDKKDEVSYIVKNGSYFLFK